MSLEEELPKLEGTKKQVAWGEHIRSIFVKAIETEENTVHSNETASSRNLSIIGHPVSDKIWSIPRDYRSMKQLDWYRNQALNWVDSDKEKDEINNYYDTVTEAWKSRLPKDDEPEKPSRDLRKSDPKKYQEMIHARCVYRQKERKAYKDMLISFAKENLKARTSAAWWIERF